MKRLVYQPHIFLLAIFCLLASYAHGQTGIRTFDYATIAAPTTVDVLRADANGNIYVAGKYLGNSAIDFSPYGTQAPLTDANATSDIFIAKYDAGGVLLWLRSALNEQSTFLEVTDLEVDASGNVFVSGSVTGNAGKFYDATTNYDVSGGAASYTGAYVVKYSSAGAITWVWNKKHVTTHYYAKGIEIDGSGNIHVGGYTNDGGGNEVSVAVLNSAGAEQSYHTLTTISSAITVTAFDRDASGNYYVTGSTNGDTPDAFVSKYDGSRVHQWNSVVLNFATAGGTGGGFAERGVDIEVDGTGNVFSLFTGNSGTFLVKYNSSGALQSGSFHITANNGNTGRDLALDGSGNVIIAGNLRGTTDFDPGAGTASGGDAFGSYYLASYTSNLAYNWSRILNHNSQTSTRISTAADVDPLGKIHMAQHWDNTGYRKGLVTTFSLAGDLTAPTATTLSPADNATNVALSASPQITFSESVSLVNGGTVTIRKQSNLTEFESFTIPSARLTLSGNTLTINPTNDFPVTSGTTSYYITISGGAVKDGAGNFFAPITTSNVWNFSTIVDSSGPALISRTPTPGSVGIDPASDLTIGFNENIVAHTGGSVTLQKLVSGAYSTVQTFSLPSGLVAISGSQTTIDPSADLSYSSTYQVLVSSNAFKDAAGNFFAGQIAGAWTFTTMAAPDVTAPTLTAKSPQDGATGVGIGNDLVLTFSEDVSGVNAKQVVLKKGDNSTIATYILPSANVSVAGNTVTINPGSDLEYLTDYYLTVQSGTFIDGAGNPFAGFSDNTTWNFTTQQNPGADVTAPQVSSFSPSGGGTGVELYQDLYAYFNEDVAKVNTKSVTIRKVSDNSVVQSLIFPTDNLYVTGNYLKISAPSEGWPGSTALYVNIEAGAIEDLAGNDFAGITNNSTWTFTTEAADVTGPAIQSTTPEDGEVNVSAGLEEIYLYFGEGISIGSGNITITGLDPIDVATTDMLSIEGGSMYINLDNPLPYDTEITVSLAAGVIEDSFGNPSGTISFSFTTEVAPDETAPVVNTFFPAVGATDVPFQRWLSLTFDEAVQFASTADKYLRIYNSSDVLVDEVLVVSGSFSTIASGTILRLYYQKNLEFGVEHYATLDAGAVKDMSGNDFAGIGADEWYFTVESEAGALGRYSNFIPAKNATGVDNSLVQLSFNVYFPNKQGGTIALRKVSDDGLVKQWAVTDAEVTVTGGGHTINATNIPGLEYNTEYYVELTGTSFSADGELSWGAFYAPEYLQYHNWNDDNTFWRFTTEAEPDTENPYIVQLSPEHNSEDVSITANLQATFNENVLANFGAVNIRKLSGNTLIESISIGDAAASISGAVLTINPTADFEYETSYYIDISVTGLKDATGNTFAGLSGSQSWTFTTEAAPDNQAPVVTSFSPANGATGVTHNNWVYTMTFDEDVQLGTGVNSIIILYQYSNDGLATSETVGNILEVEGNTARIDFNALGGVTNYNLTYDTKYFITVPANAIRDLNNNYFAGISTKDGWSFTLESEPDLTAPVVVDRSPANGAEINPTGVSFSLTFSEAVAKGTGTIQIRNVAGDGVVQEYLATDGGIVVDGDSWYLDFEVDFSAAGGSYYWVIPSTAITDLEGNPFAGFDSTDDWYFSTYETQAPTVASLSPANGATDIATNNWEYTVTFNEDVAAGTGTISLLRYDDDVLVTSGTVADLADVSGSVATLDFNFDAGLNSTTLDYSTKYYISIPATSFADANSNFYAGTANKDTWYFTTMEQDVTAPTITATVPDYNFVTDVPVNTPFSLTFSEDIQAGEGMVRLRVSGNDIAVIDPSDMTIDGATASYTLTADLPHNSTIQVVVEQDAFRDLAGNSYSNPTNAANYSFVTVDIDDDAPVISSRSPENGAELNPNDISFSLTFDEPIAKGTGTIQIRNSNGDGVIYEYLASSAEVVADGSTWSLASDLDFSVAGGSYYWVIPSSAITDLAGNPFGGFDSTDDWYFSTYETQAPTVTSLSPANGATGMARNNWEYTITFSEDIEVGTGAIFLYQYDNEGQVVSYGVANMVEINGSTATLDFNYNGVFNNSQLSELTKYYIVIPATAFKDLAGNSYPGTENKDTWAFTVGDFTAPYLVSSEPEDGDEAVSAANSQIVLELSETVVRGGANDIVINPGNHLIDPNASGVIEIDGNSVTINHGLSFEYGDEVTVTIYNDVFRDLGNNALPATQINFTIESSDLTAPTISSFDPALNSTHSGINDNFLAYFSESVSAVDGKKVEVRRYDTDEVLQSNTFPSDFISIGSGALVITAENAWPEGTELYILIDNGAALDEAGNEFAGITDKDTWKFTVAVPDTAGPEVVSTSPASGDIDVTVAALEIAIEFDENISTGPDATLVNISTYGDIDITSFEGASITDNYLYLDLSGLLPSQTEITVTLPEGVVVDEAGNLSPEYVFSFTTEDNGKQNQEIAFTEIASKTYGDAAFELEATSDSGLEVSFEVVSGPVTITGSTVTITGAGEATIKATQAGNDNYNAASPVERSFSIAKKGQEITFTEIASKTYGDAAFELAATSNSDLVVSFEVVSGPLTISGSTVTITGAGEATIKATQAGNDNYNAASPVERSFSIAKKGQDITFAEIASKTYGDAAFELAATSNSDLAVSFEVVSGPVTISGNTVTITGAGEATIKANQAGNDNYNAASPVERSFSIAKKGQSITIAAIDDKLTTSEAFEIEASVDSDLELTYEASGPATLDGTTLTLSGDTGAVTVVVSQAGNDNYLAAEASETFDVTAPVVTEKTDQTITFANISDKTFGDAPFVLEASASSELPVTFEVITGPVSIDGTTVTINGAGQATIKATQPGNANFNAAVAVEKSFSIGKKAQVITFSPIADKLTTDAPFDVTATAGSGLSITYVVSGPASISGSTVTLSGEPGTVTVTATQAGNENYLSAEAAETFEVTTPAPSTFSISGSAITSANVAFISGQARLHPKNGDGSFATAITASLSGTGSFSFEGLLAGQYALSVTSTDNQILTSYYDGALSLAEATIISVSNANVSGLSVVMEDKPTPPTGPGSIKGTLLLVADGGRKIVTDGRVMEGTPLAGVTIYLVNATSNDLIATTQTAADGSFQFNNLPLGAYKLLVDYEGKTSIESPEIVITEDNISFDVASEVTEDGIVIVAEPTVTNGIASHQLSLLLTVYPNPSNGVVTLQWDGEAKDILEIIIHNNNGSAVWRGNVAADQQIVDISQHPSGVYFLRLITDKGTAIQKLVIK